MPQLYGLAEFAGALGWDRRKLSTYVSRGLIPEPFERLSSGPIWTSEQVEAFVKNGEKIENIEVWPVRKEKRDTPYLLGRLWAVLLSELPEDSVPVDQGLRPVNIGTQLSKLIPTLNKKSTKMELVVELTSDIDEFPESMTDEEQSQWWLGYYHQKSQMMQ